MSVKKIAPSRFKKRQSGLSLLESLVALVVLALGIMGLAGVQTRLLVETRTANSRAVAVQLIDDLTNRMALNRLAAIGRPVTSPFTPVASLYTFANFAAVTSATQDCTTNSCTATQMAQFDLASWRTAVTSALPGSDATVFQLSAANGDPRQLGVLIGWPLNERSTGSATTDATYIAPFNTTNTNVICPATLICHVVYVQP